MSKNYYSHVFLEKCKFIDKGKKISRYINGDLEISSDDSDEEASDESDKEVSEKSYVLPLTRNILKLNITLASFLGNYIYGHFCTI